MRTIHKCKKWTVITWNISNVYARWHRYLRRPFNYWAGCIVSYGTKKI